MLNGTVAITPIPIPGALLPGLLPLWWSPVLPRGFEGGGGLGTTGR
jgi:hypothetical protein